MEKKIFVDGEFGKVCFVLNDTGNKDEIVIIIHGFTSQKNSRSVKSAAKILNNLGISSIRVDLDNVGESELDIYDASVTNYIKQIEAVAKYVKGKGFEKISLVGGSFGGVVAIGYEIKHNDIKRMVLRCPGSGAYFRYLKNGEGKEYERVKEKGFELRDDMKISFNCIEDLKKYYPLEEKVSKVKIPVEIVHGTKDKVIPYESSVEICNNSDAKLITIEGAEHNLAVDEDYSQRENQLEEFFKK